MSDIKDADFPAKCRDLIEAIGIEAAVKLCRACGGRQMYIPMFKCVTQAARRRQIVEAAARGDAVETIAEKFGTSPRYIKAVIAGLHGFSPAEADF